MYLFISINFGAYRYNISAAFILLYCMDTIFKTYIFTFIFI